jgi:capsular polysaccharide transport system permease protein
LDTPLSSILRPGPAAPGNDETRGEAPIDDGAANARPAAEGQSAVRPSYQDDRPLTRSLQDPDAAARAALEAAPTLRQPQDSWLAGQQPQITRPVPYQPQDARPAAYPPKEARVTASYQPQEARQPAEARATGQQPPAAQPAVQQASRSAAQQPAPNDDVFAGLEAAALRDIGEDLSRQPPASDDEAPAKTNRQGRQNRADKADNKAGKGELTKSERQEKRAEKLKRQEAKGKTRDGVSLPATTTGRAVEGKSDKPVRKREKGPKTSTAAPREWGIPWTALSFLVMVLIPAAIAFFYYVFIASPQYQVETQFAVRGSSQSSISTMGLPSILGGTTTQTGDSYIVTSYVESLQLIRDVQQELGIDLRQFYTRDHIDWLYRIEPDMPLEKFTEYWRDMTDVSFNATTGNTTLYIYGFTAEDSKAIADAVLKVSEKLVNQLSEANRQQVMQVASKQVDRAEERLRKVQAEIRKLREQEKTTDPQALVQIQTQLTGNLEGQLSGLKTRLSALLKSVSAEAPQAKALQKQIDALEAQITEQKSQLGNATGDGKDLSDEEKANLAEVLNKFEELTIEQTFATQAYTTALAAFETAIVEAQRQERYFATFVAPTRPEIALYPMRYLDSFIAFLVLLAAWMATQFLYRSFRDHAI